MNLFEGEGMFVFVRVKAVKSKQSDDSQGFGSLTGKALGYCRRATQIL